MTRSWKTLTVLTILTGFLAAEARAQIVVGSRPPARGAVPEAPAGNEFDAARTKQALDQILRMYPPSLRQMLQLDPSLLTNTAYLATYPNLANFLKEHPAVAHNPAYFVGVPKEPAAAPRPPQVTYVYRGLDTLSYSALFLGLVGGIAWLIRATIDHQKWLRLSKAQAEAQAKLLERFTSNEDLLNFIQTPAGQRFMEASSLPVQPKTVSVPVSQILWSMQIGLVLFAGGAGLQYVSPESGPGTTQTFHLFGVVVLALGLGFILSAFSSYALSKRLGLLSPTNVPSETPPS